VTLLERGAPGREATWASAGMLSPQAEADGPGPALDFGMRSRELYPEFAAEIERLSGIDVGYRASGVFWLALSDEDEAKLGQREAWQRRAGLTLERLDAPALRDAEPALTPELRFGLFFPGDHQVDARRLGEAAAAAAARAGVRVVAGRPARRLVVEHDRVTAVATDAETLATGHVVVAAGAWSGEIEGAGLPPGAVRPVRGQILELDPQTPIGRVVFTSIGYLVPKPRGRLLVGSTMEEAGFAKEVTVAGVRAILDGTHRIAPALATAPITDLWSGLRPMSADTKPILGPGPVSGLTFATGHGRKGVLHAPLTAAVVTAVVTGAPPTFDLAPFGYQRLL
jgi:glycine oxidase